MHKVNDLQHKMYTQPLRHTAQKPCDPNNGARQVCVVPLADKVEAAQKTAGARAGTLPAQEALTGPSDAPSVQESEATSGVGSLTCLYFDVMRAAVRSSHAWGPWAALAKAARGLGVLAMVAAPVGLPCAMLADAAKLAALGAQRIARGLKPAS